MFSKEYNFEKKSKKLCQNHGKNGRTREQLSTLPLLWARLLHCLFKAIVYLKRFNYPKHFWENTCKKYQEMQFYMTVMTPSTSLGRKLVKKAVLGSLPRIAFRNSRKLTKHSHILWPISDIFQLHLSPFWLPFFQPRFPTTYYVFQRSTSSVNWPFA